MRRPDGVVVGRLTAGYFQLVTDFLYLRLDIANRDPPRRIADVDPKHC